MPAAQLVQLVVLPALAVPGKHAEQAVAPAIGATEPAAQAAQSIPAVAANVPALQFVQTAAPAALLEPGAQLVQIVAATPEYVPAVQGKQLVCPDAEEKVPGAQNEHVAPLARVPAGHTCAAQRCATTSSIADARRGRFILS